MGTDKKGLLKSLHLSPPVFICGSILLFLSGCVVDRPDPHSKRYKGPTLSLVELVEAINQNNLRVPTLVAYHDFDATFFDDKKRPVTVVGDGTLTYQSPQSLLLIGNKPGIDVFEIGSNRDRFWLRVPQTDTMWWGDYSKIDTLENAEIPIRPDLIVQVLGIGAIETDFTREPVPIMRFNDAADAYMLVWNVRFPDRWVAQREVWYDRATKLPRGVVLFDENGRPVLHANLSKHQPVDPNDPKSPKVATEYRLFFPATGAKMFFKLKDEPHMRLTKGKVPNEQSFSFPEEPQVSKVIPIHAQQPR